MLVDSLKKIIKKEEAVEITNKLFLRNLLKESLQLYVLDYIYSSSWGENFLFTGGTCLRFCFELPRLSEDLDFDIKDYDNFNLDKFCQSLNDYFTKKLQYKNFSYKIAKNKMQIYLKFPIMEELGLRKDSSESPILFLRIDLSPIDSSKFSEEVSLISADNFNFIIKRYSLSDLFASKISAVLERTFKKGKNDVVTFKGRDYFDLIWFLQKGIKPNYKRIEDITGVNKTLVVKEIDNKVKQVNKMYLKEDLLPLFRESGFVDDFCNNFQKLYKSLTFKDQP
ncbi:MAG: nucleotidyl transferase AbiEii/AbiGii toxin family protein [Candidatus Beckwithbacteria bacterium]